MHYAATLIQAAVFRCATGSSAALRFGQLFRCAVDFDFDPTTVTLTSLDHASDVVVMNYR